MAGTPKSKKRATWDNARDLFLIKYILKATREGKKSDDTGFKASVWKDLETLYNQKFNITPPVYASQIQTRKHMVLAIAFSL
jgi:hypothetical protein